MQETGDDTRRSLDEFVCPISLCLPQHPVIAEDGQLYERRNIEAYFARDPDARSIRSPVLNTPMGRRLIEARNVLNFLRHVAETWQRGADSRLEEWCRVRDREAHANRRETNENGVVRCFKDGEHVRTLYPSDHPYHGIVHVYNEGRLVRAEYDAQHVFHGRVDVYDEHGVWIRMEYLPSHPWFGHIWTVCDDEFVRLEFATGHVSHGVIHVYADGQLTYTIFSECHPRHGMIRSYENGMHVRTTYEDWHPNFGVVIDERSSNRKRRR